MIPTDATREAIERARWTPEPETVAALTFIKATLTAPESDGKSMLERVYMTCPHENQRCAEIEAAGFAFLNKRFGPEFAFFKADCPDDGRVRFELRISDSHRGLASTPPAKDEWNLNLLKPHDEWVVPPKPELVLTRPVEPARRQAAKAKAKPLPNGMKR